MQFICKCARGLFFQARICPLWQHELLQGGSLVMLATQSTFQPAMHPTTTTVFAKVPTRLSDNFPRLAARLQADQVTFGNHLEVEGTPPPDEPSAFPNFEPKVPVVSRLAKIFHAVLVTATLYFASPLFSVGKQQAMATDHSGSPTLSVLFPKQPRTDHMP